MVFRKSSVMERTIALFSFFPLRLRTLSAAGSYLPAFKPREESRLGDGC
jgi:hypothetical protein